MNTRTSAVGTALVLCASFGAVAPLASAPEAVPATKPQAAYMTYKFVPNQALRYRIVQRWTGTAPTENSTTPSNVNAELVSLVQVWCEEMKSNGITRIAVGTESSMMKVDGKPRADTQAQSSVAYFRGNRQTLGATNMDFGSAASVILMNALPPQRASVGQSWEVIVPVQRSMDSRLRLRFKLDSIAQADAGSMANIKLTISQLSPRVNDGRLVPDGTLDGKAVVVFDIARGRLVSIRGDVVSNIALAGMDPKNRNAVIRSSLRTEFAAEMTGEVTAGQQPPTQPAAAPQP